MQIVRELIAPVAPAEIFVHVATLDAYPAWMPLVHSATRIDESSDDEPIWRVELRAGIGGFARSKRLRMRRCEYEPNRLAVFRRDEDDGRDHAEWELRAEVEARPADTRLTMTMRYGGSLWAPRVMERVLDDQVRQGSEALLSIVTSDAVH